MEKGMGSEYREVMEKLEDERRKNSVRPRIGLLPTGHFYYWPQFPGLKEMGLRMHGKFLEMLKTHAEVVTPGLVDTPEKAAQAGELFIRENVDMVLIFPLGYTTSMNVVPAVRGLDASA